MKLPRKTIHNAVSVAFCIAVLLIVFLKKHGENNNRFYKESEKVRIVAIMTGSDDLSNRFFVGPTFEKYILRTLQGTPVNDPGLAEARYHSLISFVVDHDEYAFWGGFFVNTRTLEIYKPESSDAAYRAGQIIVDEMFKSGREPDVKRDVPAAFERIEHEAFK